MALTNAERQAKWRERLRAKAGEAAGFAGAPSFEAAMRARISELLPAALKALGDDRAIAGQVSEAILSMSDAKLADWFRDCLEERCAELWGAAAKAQHAQKRTKQMAAQRPDRKPAKK